MKPQKSHMPVGLFASWVAFSEPIGENAFVQSSFAMQQGIKIWWTNRGKKTWFIFVPGVIFVIIIAVFASVIIGRRQAEHVHVHAGFHVYVDGVKQDYSDLKHMSLEPCGATSSTDDVRHKVHLHDKVGDVAHIHAAKVTWGDLFTSVGISYSSTLRPYLNGKPVDANIIFTTVIANNDSAVFAYGDNSSFDITQALAAAPAASYIEQTAAKSTGCGSETTPHD